MKRARGEAAQPVLVIGLTHSLIFSLVIIASTNTHGSHDVNTHESHDVNVPPLQANK